jgi:hypothetical protein
VTDYCKVSEWPEALNIFITLILKANMWMIFQTQNENQEIWLSLFT